MRLLIVIAQYYPALNPNVYRWGAIARYWSRQGHEVHILCTRRHGCPDEAVMEGVIVHRSGQNSLLDAIYNITKTKKRRGEAGGDSPKRKGRLRLLLEKIADYTWRYLYWPDGRCLWYLPACKTIKRLLRQNQFDALISVGLPFTAHLIGQYAKNLHPKLPWLMDVEDPFCFSDAFFVNNFFLYRRLNVWAERNAFARADAIALTAANALERYRALFPESALKMQLTLPLFDLNLPKRSEPLNNDGKIRLAYFGAFYRNIRTPDVFLAMLNQVVQDDPVWKDRLEVHFWGEIDAIFQPAFDACLTLHNNIIQHGLAPRDVLAAAIPAMDFLVSIGNTTDYHLPSKCVDYMASGKPIIHLSYTDSDPFTIFLTAYPLLLTLDARQDLHSNVALFVAFLKQNQGLSVPDERIEDWLKPCRVEEVSKAYLASLQNPVF